MVLVVVEVVMIVMILVVVAVEVIWQLNSRGVAHCTGCSPSAGILSSFSLDGF